MRSDLFVIAQPHEDGYLILTGGDSGVFAFETKEAAEDFADGLDEPGEFEAIEYDLSMGPCVVVI